MFAAVLVASGACKKDGGGDKAPAKAAPVTAPATAGTVGPDGVRKVPVEAGSNGYVPERIVGKAGEKLDLVFTRTADSECISQLKTPDGKTVDLPLGKAVDVAITVPPTGELAFACGMDMFHGAIVAN